MTYSNVLQIRINAHTFIKMKDDNYLRMLIWGVHVAEEDVLDRIVI